MCICNWWFGFGLGSYKCAPDALICHYCYSLQQALQTHNKFLKGMLKVRQNCLLEKLLELPSWLHICEMFYCIKLLVYFLAFWNYSSWFWFLLCYAENCNRIFLKFYFSYLYICTFYGKIPTFNIYCNLTYKFCLKFGEVYPESPWQ